MDHEYSVCESTEFATKYKKVLKKYRKTFDDDYSSVLRVIRRTLPVMKGDAKKIPKSKVIAGLGEKIRHPIVKTRIFIEQAKDTTGRIVYLVDKELQRVFLIDVYYHPAQKNHCDDTIKRAYKEYLALPDES